MEFSSAEDLDDWVPSHYERLQIAADVVRTAAHNVSRRKRLYDLWARGALIRPDDRVLLRKRQHRGRNKILDR